MVDGYIDIEDTIQDNELPTGSIRNDSSPITASSSESDETRGYIDPDDIIIPQGKQYSIPESMLMGAERGLTLDFADELKGAINQGLSTGQDVFNKLGIAQYPSPYTVDEQLMGKKVDPYYEARDEARQEYKEAFDQNPKSSFVGMMGGGLLTTPLLPAKVVAPLGQVGKMAPVLSKEFVKQAGKTAINSIPLSVAAGVGASEADNALDLLKDVGISAGAGMVLSPLLEKGGQVVANKLPNMEAPNLEGVDKAAGGIGAKFKAGYEGNLQYSVNTTKKINKALNTIVSKTRNAAESEKALIDFNNNQVIKINDEAINLLNNTKEKLKQNLDDLKYKQSVFVKTRKDENSAKSAQIMSDEIGKIEKQILDVDNKIKIHDDKITSEIESSKKELADMMKQYDEHIAAQEQYNKAELQNTKDELNLNKNRIDYLSDKESQYKNTEANRIARKLQEAAGNDLNLIKSGLDDVQSRYDQAGVNFNLKNPINDFIKSLQDAYGTSQDEALSNAVLKIEKSLSPYKKQQLDANGLAQFKYGNDNVRSVIDKDIKDLFPQNRALDKTFSNLVRKLENDIDETKYFQTVQFGKGSPQELNQLVEDDKLLRKAYANLKYNDPYKLSEVNKAIGGPEYNTGVATELKDLGVSGVEGTNKGSDLYKFLDYNSELMPDVNLVKRQDLEKYLKDLQDIRNTKSTIQADTEGVSQQAKLLEDKLNELKLNKKQPVENLTSIDREFNDNVSYLQGKVESLTNEPTNNKLELQKKLEELQLLKKQKVIDPKQQGAIDILENEIRDLNLDPKSHPEYQTFDQNINKAETDINEILKNISQVNRDKNAVGKPTTPFYKTVKEQLLNTPEDSFNSKMRNLVFGREGDDGIAGKQQRLEKILADFNLTNDKEVKQSLKTIEKLEPLMSEQQMSGVGLGTTGNVYGNILDLIGTGANFTGYAAGLPQRLTQKAAAPLNKGLNYIGKQNIVPTTSGLKNIDEVLANVTNKPIKDIMEMDSVSRAALKNNLLQISPEIRKYLNDLEEENKK